MLLSVPSASSHDNTNEITQTTKTLDFSMALRHLQVVTQAKVQLEQELLHKQEEQWTRMQEQVNTTFR